MDDFSLKLVDTVIELLKSQIELFTVYLQVVVRKTVISYLISVDLLKDLGL